MRIYFDTCCISRPDDDQNQERVRAETAAILSLFEACERGEHDWIASVAIVAEVRSNPDPEKRANAMERLSGAAELLLHPELATARARELIAAGVGSIDAYHLALAEAAQCDALFTTDDQFKTRAARLSPASPVVVYNPADWPEVTP